MVGGTGTQMIGNKIAQRNFNDRNLPEAAALSGALALLVLAPMLLRRREKTATA
jgi:spermidine/putrescine transport system permease protein